MDDDDLDGAALMDLGRVMELGGNLDGAVQMYERAAEGTGTLISVRVGGKAFPKTARLVPGPLDAILAILGGVGAAELQLCATRLREVHLEDEAVLGLRDAVSGRDRGIQEEVDAIGPLRVG